MTIRWVCDEAPLPHSHSSYIIYFLSLSQTWGGASWCTPFSFTKKIKMSSLSQLCFRGKFKSRRFKNCSVFSNLHHSYYKWIEKMSIYQYKSNLCSTPNGFFPYFTYSSPCRLVSHCFKNRDIFFFIESFNNVKIRIIIINWISLGSQQNYKYRMLQKQIRLDLGNNLFKFCFKLNFSNGFGCLYELFQIFLLFPNGMKRSNCDIV